MVLLDEGRLAVDAESLGRRVGRLRTSGEAAADPRQPAEREPAQRRFPAGKSRLTTSDPRL
jgi:hypothetical protein